ncbi:uncharacterized protein [Populus alba]|uniref:uncharacterized protein isoform X2 n=1 Tax=Populus alba TaxID=43335 RepID=UPI003CC7539A
MWLCHVASWLCRRVLFWFSWIGRVWLMGDKVSSLSFKGAGCVYSGIQNQWLLFYNWKKLCACQLVIGSSFPLFCFISSAWLLLLCLDLLGSVCCPACVLYLPVFKVLNLLLGTVHNWRRSFGVWLCIDVIT